MPYKDKEKCRECHERYSKTKRGRLSHKKAIKKWRESNKEKYAETKSKATAKRRRNLGFNKLMENDWGCEIDWHHVNDDNVVPIPRDLHQMCPSSNKEVHREICNELVNILYEGELKV
jgi:hypothetical protein